MILAPMASVGCGKGDCVSHLVDNILGCYAELSKFPDLKPSTKVNKTFEKLVDLCSQCPGEDVVTQVWDPAVFRAPFCAKLPPVKPKSRFLALIRQP